MRPEQNRVLRPPELRNRWGRCWGAFLCFNSQKCKGGGKRIVPATRIPDNYRTTASAAVQANGAQHQATALAAPPSSPVSVSNPNSALSSTPQSPSCFFSANSPQRPSIYSTGPYAHETQLVSPPVFSTFTTEPSTAPLTPPPLGLDLAHLTCPSSPDVPFAQFLSASTLTQPISRNPNDGLSFVSKWDTAGSPTNGTHQDTNFFCPATFAEFYANQDPTFPHNVGRLSVSRDVEVTSATGNGQHPIRQIASPKQDQEEIEAYRASFGFSADEIVVSTHYVEITDVAEDSFTMSPFPSDKSVMEASMEHEERGIHKAQSGLAIQSSPKTQPNLADREENDQIPVITNCYRDYNLKVQGGQVFKSSNAVDTVLPDEEDTISKWGSSKIRRKYQLGLSSSDAEIDYGKRRGVRAVKGDIL